MKFRILDHRSHSV